MWKLLSRSTLRERKNIATSTIKNSSGLVSSNPSLFFPFSNNNNNNNNTQHNNNHAFSTTSFTNKNASVAVQLDYYMSIQFAGIANALVTNKYGDAGIDSLNFLPTCPVGLEQARVRAHQDSSAAATTTTIGSVEQNIFIPTLHRNPELRTTAVAAMFRQSPLCVASLVSGDSGDEEEGTGSPVSNTKTISAHEDTVELMQRIYGTDGDNSDSSDQEVKVVAGSRATKVQDLMSGAYDGIQAYTTTEVPTLERMLLESSAKDSRTLQVQPLEGFNGAKLGYSQVLFAADECLAAGDDRREVVQAFLKATFDGWQQVIQHQPLADTVEQVLEACHMLKLDDETNDHWFRSRAFNEDMLRGMNSHVKETFLGDRFGTIDTQRWNGATQWLLLDEEATPPASTSASASFGLDPTVWKPASNLLAGNGLAHHILEQVKIDADKFASTYDRKPQLAVVTVGDLPRYLDADRRLDLYSNSSNSWYSKTSTGEAHGLDVQEITLDGDGDGDTSKSVVTTEDLLSCIYKLREDKDVDGIQLMWPLPAARPTWSGE
jgi:hypothetical protein